MQTAKLMVLLGILAAATGCSGSGTAATTASTAVTAGAATDLRSKVVVNEAAYIPAMCWTKTEDTAGVVHNPCFSCHTASAEPNYNNDQALQQSYDFPEYARTNHWSNLFKDRSTQVADISDSDILAYIRASNYLGVDSSIKIASLLAKVPSGWDFNGNGVWDGYLPDSYLNFDAEGFDRKPNGDYTGWRAFAYYPFLGTFWPTNGSTDDVMIRLGEAFRKNSAGQFDLTVYKVNLAIVEAVVKRSNIAITAVNENLFGVDLDKSGSLGIATSITYDWAPLQGKQMSYVGLAGLQQAAGTVHLAAGLFPEGTEFLHSVRYIDVTATGGIALGARMKELRYAKKRSWYSYADLEMQANAAVKEKASFPDRLETYIGDVEQGIGNGQGWVYQGFIEDRDGNLRPQTYEETIFCMGCHGKLGVTSDGIFSFPRKLNAGSFQQGWYHWSQKGLSAVPEPILVTDSGSVREYSFYLLTNGAGDELRENLEVYNKFFDAAGSLQADMVSQLNNDVTVLLNPSSQRALLLDKAYRVLVKEQSFVYGRDAVVTPARNVHQSVSAGQSTKVMTPVNSYRAYQP